MARKIVIDASESRKVLWALILNMEGEEPHNPESGDSLHRVRHAERSIFT